MAKRSIPRVCCGALALTILLLSGCISWPMGNWFHHPVPASAPPPSPPPNPANATSPTNAANSPSAATTPAAGAAAAPGAPAPPPGSRRALAAAGFVEPGVQRDRPTAIGSQLNLKPDETVVERALELKEKLNAAEEEKKVITARLLLLETALADKDRALRATEQEVQSATDELIKARKELENWRVQVLNLRDKLRNAEKENLATLQSIVSVLEQLLEQKHPEGNKEAEPESDKQHLPPLKRG